MGKSSLLRSFLNGYGIPHILIGARRIVVNEGRMNIRGFMNELSQALTEFLRRRSSVLIKISVNPYCNCLGSLRWIGI